MPAFNYTSGNPNNLAAGINAAMADIQGPFTDLKTAINGGLDETNVPNLAAAFTKYTTIMWGGGQVQQATVSGAGAYLLFAGPSAGATQNVSAQTFATQTFHLDPADFAANARTTKLRLKASCIVNAVAPGMTLTPGLYPVNSFSGTASNAPLATNGTVITGSTVVFTTPAANSVTTATSGDFTFPAAGHYVLLVAASAGAAATSVTDLMVQLQVRQT